MPTTSVMLVLLLVLMLRSQKSRKTEMSQEAVLLSPRANDAHDGA
jgi:hypothetical protein